MELDTVKVSGADAVEKLMALRSEFSSSGEYPFIIGSADELGRIQENAEFAEGEPTKDLDLASSFDLQAWLSSRKDDLGFEEFDESEIQGDWPGAMLEKAGITAHTNIMNGRPLKEVYIGLVNISEPWQCLRLFNMAAGMIALFPQSKAASCVTGSRPTALKSYR
ncbi:MAG: hypothetical protein AAF085_08920 [Planctomycetota bacterium]